MRSFISRPRKWISDIPVHDPVDRRMAILLQVVLIGFIIIIVIAAVLNLAIADEIPQPVILIRSAIAILIIGIPLILLRRGYYRSSALIIIALFCLLEGFAVITANLRDIAETLSFLTLAIILAGLLVSPRALVHTFLFSVVLVGYGGFQEWTSGLGEDGIVIAGNFILLNGLISLFLHRFGVTLRAALTSSLAREEELQAGIVERKRVQQDLAASEAKYRAFFENSMDAILLTSPDGSVYGANPAACQMLERTELEIIQAGRTGLVDVSDPRLTEILAERTRAGKARGELNMLRRDGTPFPAEISSALFQDSEGNTRTSMILRDITQQKEAEEEREDLIKQLTAKNAELEQFVYTVSHDLKSPLVTIRGYLGFLEEDALSGNLERHKRDTQRISNAVENMQVLLRDLLELSRVGRFVNPPQVVSFDELAGDAIEVVEGQIKQRGVTVEVQPNLPPVYGDKTRLVEVLQNLLDNAIKYMGDQPEPHIEIGYRGMENDRHVLYVKDNGVGIHPEYRERIFGLFDKLDAGSEGTGVGLTLVKRIIEYHGGRIWIESEAGKGSTFLFTLEGAPLPDYK